MKIISENIIKQQTQISKQQEQLSELLPKIGNNITNNTQNNKFNINVFLNEKCKDAINMTDFVKSIEVSLQQLDFTKNNGNMKSKFKQLSCVFNNLPFAKVVFQVVYSLFCCYFENNLTSLFFRACSKCL